MDISEEELHTLYTWVDEIPLSRPKRNIARDFSDGVLMAETIKHYFPNLVELHNYSPANAVTQKMYNWETLNTRVFKRLGFSVPRAEAESVANCVPGAVERVLKLVKVKMATYKARKTGGGGSTGTLSPPTATSASRWPEDAPAAAPAPAGVSNPTRSTAAANNGGASGAGGGGGGGAGGASYGEANLAMLEELEELRDTCQILETKVKKLEQLVRLKDTKISALTAKWAASQ